MIVQSMKDVSVLAADGRLVLVMVSTCNVSIGFSDGLFDEVKPSFNVGSALGAPTFQGQSELGHVLHH